MEKRKPRVPAASMPTIFDRAVPSWLWRDIPEGRVRRRRRLDTQFQEEQRRELWGTRSVVPKDCSAERRTTAIWAVCA